MKKVDRQRKSNKVKATDNIHISYNVPVAITWSLFNIFFTFIKCFDCTRQNMPDIRIGH